DTTGLIKLVVNTQNQQIVGVHIVAENAGEVIYAGTLAVKFGLTIEDLTDTMAPYLTMVEGLKLAALGYNNDISKLSWCAGSNSASGTCLFLMNVYRTANIQLPCS